MQRVMLILVLSLGLMAPVAGAQENEAPADGPRVDAAAICLGVEDHQPVGEASVFSADVDRLYCWTRLADLEGQTVVHAWIHEGTTRARVSLRVGSPMWRTYSSKRILPSWTGDWEVKVMTQDGQVLSTLAFQVESSGS